MVQSSQERGTVSPEQRARGDCLLILISIPELGICLVGKVHVIKMKLIFNFFSLLVVQIPQTSYCIFKKSVICLKLITCSATLSLHAADRAQQVL